MPDRVLAWIGVSGNSLGEDDVSRRVEGGMGKVEGGVQSATNATVAAVTKNREKLADPSAPADPKKTKTSSGDGGDAQSSNKYE